MIVPISWWSLSVAGVAVYYLLRKFVQRLKVRNLKNKAVFITNCDNDFGKEIALKCVHNGIPVYVGYLIDENKQKLEEEAKGAKGRLVTLKLNVTDTNSVNEAVRFVSTDLPSETKLWALLNTDCTPSNDESKDLGIVEKIYIGAVRCSRAFLPLIKRSGGRIANTSGIPRHLMMPWGSENVGTHKLAIESYTKHLAKELKHYKVKTAVFTSTEFASQLYSTETIKKRADNEWNKTHPDNRTQLGDQYVPKIVNHWSEVLKQRSLENVQKMADGYYHFITAIYPQFHYHYGYSRTLRAFCLLALRYIEAVHSYIRSILVKQKDA